MDSAGGTDASLFAAPAQPVQRLLDPRGHRPRPPVELVEKPSRPAQAALGEELVAARVERRMLRLQLPPERAVVRPVARMLAGAVAAVLERDRVDALAAPAVLERVQPQLPVLERREGR